MATRTLREFIDQLDSAGELARISVPVSPLLEVSEIANRMSKMPAPHVGREIDGSHAANLGGKALLFENVTGCDFPLAMNLYGSYWRICQALSCARLQDVADRIAKLVKPEIPTNFFDKLKQLPKLLELGSYPPKVVSSGICQEVVLEG